MSRFRFKPILWTEDGDVSSSYSPAGTGSGQFRTTDPDLPRVNEIFQDKKGDLHLFKKDLGNLYAYKHFRHSDHYNEDLEKNAKLTFRSGGYPTVVLHVDNFATVLGYESGLIRFVKIGNVNDFIDGATWASVNLDDYNGGSGIGATGNRHPIALGFYPEDSSENSVFVKVLTSNNDLFVISIKPDGTAEITYAAHSDEYVDISEFEDFFLRKNLTTGVLKVARSDYSYEDIEGSAGTSGAYIAPRSYWNRDLKNEHSNCAVVGITGSNSLTIWLAERAPTTIYNDGITKLTEFSQVISSKTYRGAFPLVYQIGNETLIALFSGAISDHLYMNSNSIFAVLYHKGKTKLVEIRTDYVEGADSDKEFLAISPVYDENNSNSPNVSFKLTFAYKYNGSSQGIKTYEVIIPDNYEEVVDATLVESSFDRAATVNSFFGISSKKKSSYFGNPFAGVTRSVTFYDPGSGLNQYIRIKEYAREVGNKHSLTASIVGALHGIFASIQATLLEVGDVIVNRCLTVYRDVVSVVGSFTANAGNFIAEKGDFIGNSFRGNNFSGNGEISNTKDENLPGNIIRKTVSFDLEESTSFLSIDEFNFWPGDEPIAFVQFGHRGSVGGSYMAYGSNRTLEFDALAGKKTHSYFGHTNLTKGKYFNFLAVVYKDGTSRYKLHKFFGFYRDDFNHVVYDEIDLSSFIGRDSFDAFLGFETGRIESMAGEDHNVEALFIAEGRTGDGSVHILTLQFGEDGTLRLKNTSARFEVEGSTSDIEFVIPGMISYFNGNLRLATSSNGSPFYFINMHYQATWNPNYSDIIRTETMFAGKVTDVPSNFENMLSGHRRFFENNSSGCVLLGETYRDGSIDLKVIIERDKVYIVKPKDNAMENFGSNSGALVQRAYLGSDTRLIVNGKVIPEDYASDVGSIIKLAISGDALYYWKYMTTASGITIEYNTCKGLQYWLSANLSGLKADYGRVTKLRSNDFTTNILAPGEFLEYNSGEGAIAQNGKYPEYARHLLIECNGAFGHAHAGTYGELNFAWNVSGTWKYWLRPSYPGQIVFVHNKNTEYNLKLFVPKRFGSNLSLDTTDLTIAPGQIVMLQADRDPTTWRILVGLSIDEITKIILPLKNMIELNPNFISDIMTHSWFDALDHIDKYSSTGYYTVPNTYMYEIGPSINHSYYLATNDFCLYKTYGSITSTAGNPGDTIWVKNAKNSGRIMVYLAANVFIRVEPQQSVQLFKTTDGWHQTGLVLPIQ